MSKNTMPTDRIASAPTVLREIPGPESCSLCDAPGLKTELVRNPFICGVGAEAVELVVDFPVHSGASCGQFYRGSDAGRLEHEAVCKHLGRDQGHPPPVRDVQSRIRGGDRAR